METLILFYFGIKIQYSFLWHNVKGLKEVLYHEYIHFKQYLLNQRLGHYRGLKAKADHKTNLDSQIKILQKNLTN